MELQVNVIGLELSEGTSKAGKAYSIGRLFSMTALAPPQKGTENIAVGFMGDVYEVDGQFVRGLKHLPCPFKAVLVVEQQMRYGERKQVVVDIKPVSVQKAAA